MERLRRYAKAIAALLGGLITWATTYLPDEPEVAKWLGLFFAFVTFVTVYEVPNKPPPGELADPNISEQGVIRNDVIWAGVGILLAAVLLGILVNMLE